MKKSFLLGLAALLLPLTSWAQGKTKLEPTYQKTVTYAGNNTQAAVGITLQVGDKTLDLYQDYQLTYKWTGNGESAVEKEVAGIRDAGKYTVSVSVTGFNYKDLYEVDNFDVIVNPLNVSTTGLIVPNDNSTPLTLEYGDELKLGSFITIDETKLAFCTDKDAEKANLLSGLQVVAVGESAGTPIEEVGKYSVAVDGVKENNPSNYIYNRTAAGVTYELNINKKLLYMTLKGKVYNTGKINLEYLGDKEKKQYMLYKDSEKETEATDIAADAAISFTYDPEDNEGVENKSGLNAGTYFLRAEITGNDDAKKHYTLGDVDDTFEYVISKADLEITKSDEAVLNKTYGEEDIDLTAQFTYTRKKSDTAGTLTAEQVKEQGLTMVREEGENVYAEEKNEEGSAVEAKYLISYKVEDDATLTNNYNIVYNYNDKDEDGKDLESCEFTIKPKSISAEGRDGYKAAYITLTEPEKKAEFVKYIGEDYVQKYRNEAPTDMEGLSLADTSIEIEDLLDEDGEVRTLVPGEDYTLIFSASADQNYAAKDADEKFTITLEGTGNYTGKIWSFGYTIAKADLVISPKEGAKFQKVTGAPDPDWYNDVFDFNTLIGEDAENPQSVVTFRISGTKDAVGLHYVNATEKDGAKNYNITYEKFPQFEILDNTVTLYGSELPEGEPSNSEKLAKYNGEEVTVKIKNFVEMFRGSEYLVENKWHSMALPFATAAKDISSQLGYAVVDVADMTNTTPGNVSFKLAVGNVPANQIFLVKLAEEKTLGEGVELEFENVTIEYELDEDGDIKVSDAGDNVFYTVYEDKALSEDASLFFVYRSNFYETATNPVTIHPLNGYIKSGAADPAKTRLLIQEANGSTTSISAVTGETKNYAVDGWYTVGGIKLDNAPTQKGVYINNGKKVVIK